jgi:tRNA(Ile)-lysidine synthase
MVEKVLRYIREEQLIAPGDRVCVAVSGGADSVALLRVLLELRPELGIVLSVGHFNHKIRGDEADADEQFVRELANKFDLELHVASADVPTHARNTGMSLETAAREVRQSWFMELIKDGKADKIATAHTQDDQAETVLMRILRGAGTRGLAGIAPQQKQKALVRPLLVVTRRAIEDYLKQSGQPWREDSSNTDFRHARNRIRHELLPLLSRDYNPAIRQILVDLAQVAQADEEYWEKEVARVADRLVRSGKPSRSGRSNRGKESATVDATTLAVDLLAFRGLPLALQRRLLRAIGERLGISLEFRHVQELLTVAGQKKPGKEVILPRGLVARTSLRELQISCEPQPEGPEYEYSLPVPGKIAVPELDITISAQVLSLAGERELSGYNAALLDRTLLAPELRVRNWRAGDRFFPAHTRSPRKVKELLQPGRLGRELSPGERKSWPVIESAGQIVWVRGLPVPEAFAARRGEAVLIEEIRHQEAGI